MAGCGGTQPSTGAERAPRAARVLDQRLTESPENLWQGHLIQAQATLASGTPLACEQDVGACSRSCRSSALFQGNTWMP